ncbi:helix-turn-helix transcriptional regulator [Streptomyces sp. NPDC006339]|uniref:helix-turn-helix domain-containing protein n=1 Tax=Streptomyces sp. NPDC006339 TaxID=3156755 RepID=UPI0033B5460A
MPDQTDALTRLVQEHVGEGRALSVRAFAQRAVDPKSGTRISKSTVGNLVQGHRIKIGPEVLAAIATGLGVPLSVVQAAAMQQYLGVVVDDPFGTPAGDEDVVVRVAHEAGKTAEDMPTVRAFLDWAERREQ